MTETNAERLEIIKDKQIQMHSLSTFDVNWLIEQAEQAEKLKKLYAALVIQERNLQKDANYEFGLRLEMKKENSQLKDQLDKIKTLVNSNRAGHAIKMDLQMMFKE